MERGLGREEATGARALQEGAPAVRGGGGRQHCWTAAWKTSSLRANRRLQRSRERGSPKGESMARRLERSSRCGERAARRNARAIRPGERTSHGGASARGRSESIIHSRARVTCVGARGVRCGDSVWRPRESARRGRERPATTTSKSLLTKEFDGAASSRPSACGRCGGRAEASVACRTGRGVGPSDGEADGGARFTVGRAIYFRGPGVQERRWTRCAPREARTVK